MGRITVTIRIFQTQIQGVYGEELATLNFAKGGERVWGAWAAYIYIYIYIIYIYICVGEEKTQRTSESHEMTLELVSGAEGADSKASWGQVWPRSGPKSTICDKIWAYFCCGTACLSPAPL
jgi:hypothetical protein